MPRPTRLHGVRAARTSAKPLRLASAAFERRLRPEVRAIALDAELPYDERLQQQFNQIARWIDRPPEHTPSGMAAELRALKRNVMAVRKDARAAPDALNFTKRLLDASPDLSRTHLALLTVQGVLRGIVEPLEEFEPSIPAALDALDHEIELLAREGGQGMRADQRQRRAAMLLLDLFANCNCSPRRAWPRARRFITASLELLLGTSPDFTKHPKRLLRLLRPIRHA